MDNPRFPFTGRVSSGGRTISYYSPDDLIKLMREGALYDRFVLPAMQAGPLVNFIAEHGLRMDAHGVGCRQRTTFVAPARESRTMYAERPNGELINDLSAMLSSVGFQCSRVPHARSHNSFFCLTATLNWENDQKAEQRTVTITKIGQWPSLADMASGKFAEYDRLISQEDLAELRRAVGLAAHGIGIGAFVYSRRIFERLVQRAESTAGTAGSTLRMDERIAALAGVLPDFVIKNRKVYGIVSKGIHELSERECIDAYPIVEAAVLLMLDEETVAAKRQARLKEAEAKLGQLQEKLGKE